MPASRAEKNYNPYAVLLSLVAGLGLILAAANLLNGHTPSISTGYHAPNLTRQNKAAKSATKAYGKLPINFMPNEGQFDRRVEYYAAGADHGFYLSRTEATYVFFKKGAKTAKRAQAYALKIKFLGANTKAVVAGRDEQIGKVNYFIGNDPKKWRSNISTFGQVTYKGLYNGIDLTYKGEKNKIKYEFVAAPWANHKDIKFVYNGADALKIGRHGDLLIATPWGTLRDERPYAYQIVDGKKVRVAAAFSVSNRTVGFSLSGYNAGLPIHIDPGLAYSGFLGGDWIDEATNIAVDDSGNAYVTGYTFSSINFPTTPGAFDVALGYEDAFIVKLNPSGSAILYASYIGGRGPDSGWGIKLDGSGNVYLTGHTASTTDFPTTFGAYDTSYSGGGYDGFFVKLNPAGGGSADLIYSTYVGGSGTDYSNAVAVDTSGTAYVTGDTTSADFPTTAGAYDTSQNGGYDIFVAKISPAGAGATDLNYSTFLGGAGAEFGNSLTIDASASVYLSGPTKSTDFPTTVGAYDTGYNGGSYDVYVSKLNLSGAGANDLVYATYLGGSGRDAGAAVAVDNAGVAYVTGDTTSIDFPTTAGVFDAGQSGGNDVFFAKIRPSGAGGGDLVYATFLGGAANEYGSAVAVDSSGTAYLTGRTRSTDFPTTADAVDISHNGVNDLFFSKLDPLGAGANDLIYSTFMGGPATDYGNAVALDGGRNAYIAGYTASAAFPTTPGVFDATIDGAPDGFIAKLDTIPPSTPTIIGFSPSSAEVSLYWKGSTDNVGVAAGYKIYNADTSAQVAATGDTSYTFGGLSSTTTYSYYIRAYDGSGNHSGASNIVRIQPGGSGGTPAGSNLTVSPISKTSVNFSNVTLDGTTTANETSTAPGSEPPGFKFQPGLVYEITTTAAFNPPIYVGLLYNESSLTVAESSLRMLHYEGGAWVDVTYSLDMTNNVIIGKVNSLSPFGVGGIGGVATGINKSWLLIIAMTATAGGIGLVVLFKRAPMSPGA